jgi:CheY-like chemotaxis protein
MIDDDADTNFLIAFLLSKLPWVDDYVIKERAKEGLDFLATCQLPLTCIFVDINMPEMDGFEFVEIYERDFMGKFPDTAVYFLTSSARQSDKQKAMDLISVKDFILKPLTKEKLNKIHTDLLPTGERG